MALGIDSLFGGGGASGTNLIAVDQNTYNFFQFGFVAVILIAGMVFIAIWKNAPEAFVLWKSRRTGGRVPVCWVHYPGGVGELCSPIFEKEDKPDGVAMPIWTVPEIGIKFKPDNFEEVENIGGATVVHYYKNVPKPASVKVAVAYDQLSKMLAKNKIDVRGIETKVFYALSEAQKTTITEAIQSTKTLSADTKKQLDTLLRQIQMNESALNQVQLQSGVFTFRTAISAIDNLLATTSSAVHKTKLAVEAATRRQEMNKDKTTMMTVIYAVIILFGLGIGYKAAFG